MLNIFTAYVIKNWEQGIMDTIFELKNKEAILLFNDCHLYKSDHKLKHETDSKWVWVFDYTVWSQCSYIWRYKSLKTCKIYFVR